VVAANIHDAVIALEEGSCDLMMVYHHPLAPILLNPERFGSLTLGRCRTVLDNDVCNATKKSRCGVGEIGDRLTGAVGQAKQRFASIVCRAQGDEGIVAISGKPWKVPRYVCPLRRR
jgi:hypothetical protein